MSKLSCQLGKIWFFLTVTKGCSLNVLALFFECSGEQGPNKASLLIHTFILHTFHRHRASVHLWSLSNDSFSLCITRVVNTRRETSRLPSVPHSTRTTASPIYKSAYRHLLVPEKLRSSPDYIKFIFPTGLGSQTVPANDTEQPKWDWSKTTDT